MKRTKRRARSEGDKKKARQKFSLYEMNRNLSVFKMNKNQVTIMIKSYNCIIKTEYKKPGEMIQFIK